MTMQKISIAFLAALSCAAVGCKKDAGGSGGDCAKAIDRSLELSKADLQKMGTDDAMFAKMRDLGVKRCTEDKWPAAATTCMLDAKNMADSQACYGKLSAEQSDKMNKAAMELMTPPAGSGSGATK